MRVRVCECVASVGCETAERAALLGVERDVYSVCERTSRSSEMRDGFLGDENEIVLLEPRRPRYTESSSDCGITPRSTASLRYSVCTGVVSGISTFMPAGLTLVPAIFAYL